MLSLSVRGMRAAFCGAFASFLLLPAAVNAKWIRAESTNFIAYSEGTAEDLKERVVDLEKFGHVLQAMTGAKRPKNVPVKIKVYFVRTVEDVGETLPYPAGGVAGYYTTTMRGPFTVMPWINFRQPAGTRYKMPGMEAKTVLQHELTHHFMFQYFPAAYPAWYVEGFADYAGAIDISEDNIVSVGLFLDNRAQSLRSMEWVPLKELMNPIPGKSMFPSFAFYPQGWITVHYLNNMPEGRKMLLDYLRRINSGATFGEALTAFGDITAFDKEVRAYARRSKLDATATKYLSLDPGPIEVTPLSPAEDSLLRTQLTLSSGVLKSNAQGFVRRVRDIVRDYPDDPYALRILADAERVAQNHAESLAVANRLLARDPADGWGNYYRAQAEIEALQQAKSADDGAWDAARGRLRAAMKAMPNEPRFGRAFYESYQKRGVLPPAAAQNALVKSLDLIPRENTLRMLVARDYEARGMLPDAIDTIAPLAYGLVDESERQKRRRERAQDQYREAEEDDDKETPREMLARLIKKRDGESGATTAAATANP
jgi:tetratricopeptide (TPR) repeat protein